MIVVSFDKELREAFSAGQASMMHLLASRAKWDGESSPFANVPRTYEEWIESQRDSPQVPIG